MSYIYINIESPNPDKEIFELSDILIKDKIPCTIKTNSVKGAMGEEMLNILSILAESAALVAVINGVFKSLNTYFSINLEKRKSQIEKNKIIISREIDGESVSIEVNKDNYKEVEKLIDMLKVK